MFDPMDEVETHTGSRVESEASAEPQPLSNPAAADSTSAAAPVPLNPDDLHDLFAGSPSLDGSDDEDPLAQMRKDPNYAALIGELEYIAAQARLLFAPAEEAPSDEVWDKIKNQLPAAPDEEA